MIKDLNMQHLSMKEYVCIALLTEMITKDETLQLFANKEVTPQQVVHTCFDLADIWMEVREERNAKT